MDCEVVAGAAVVTPSQFGPQPAYDLRPAAGPGGRVRLLVGPGVRRLYVPEPLADVSLERAPGGGAGAAARLSVVLPKSAAHQGMRLMLVGVEAELQYWPGTLALGSGSTLAALHGCEAPLAALEITGRAALDVPLHAARVTFGGGDLAPAGELTADEVHGALLTLTPAKDHPEATLRAGTLVGVRQVVLGAGTRLLLDGTQGEGFTPAGAVAFAGPGQLGVEGGVLDAPLFEDGLRLSVREKGRVVGATGTVHALRVDGGCRVDGAGDQGLVIAGVESVEDAELSAVNAFELRPHSLSALKKAAHVSFWAGRSAADGIKRARAMDRPGEDRDLALYWGALLRQVEDGHDHAQIRMTARRAELDYRRKALPRRSADRIVLEILRPIHYGQSVLAPLVAQLVICLCGALLLRSIGMLADDSPRGTLVMVVRLYFAALAGTARVSAFRPDALPGVWDTGVWLVCLLTSIFLFGAAILAARRRIIAG
ncbi:hypothetical protein AB0Q95_37415 [Streptomyces sp. NPDC059900]|uniref:hypothetical protein n=1 Tax=Streptomyces sp. NPDC059900 TaxID=3155816 RepID=UPI00342D728A